MPSLLGIDVSTTASKALLLSDRGEVVASHATPHDILAPRPLWSEQEPTMWWEAVRNSVAGVMREADVGAEEVVGIGLTGQMHGLVLLDAGGRSIRPAILWDDQRSAAECDDIRDQLGLAALVNETGNDAFPGFTLPKLLWVRNNEPEHYARVAHVLLPKDFIRYKLTGEFATDKAGAGGTLMLGLAARDWSPLICDAFDVDGAWLPRSFEGPEVTGQLRADVASALGLSPGIPVVAGGGDQAAQAVGVGAVHPGVVALTLGTSGVVFAGTDKPLTSPNGAAHAFPHAVRNRWHMMGVMLSAAGSLRWYHDTFHAGSAYDALLAGVGGVAPGCQGLSFLPYLSGERTPHADPYVRGAFVGLTHVHDSPHVTRSVLEGVAFGLRDNLDLLIQSGLAAPDVIRISGGGAQSRVWLQIIADIMSVPLVTVASNEGAAVGAAMLAGLGSGVWSDIDAAVAACVNLDGEVQPDPGHSAAYEEPLTRFRALYRALAPTFRGDIRRGSN